MTFLYQLVNRAKSNLLDLLALLVNAGVFDAVSQQLIEPLYGRQWFAAVTLSLAAFYAGHVSFFLNRGSSTGAVILLLVIILAFGLYQAARRMDQAP